MHEVCEKGKRGWEGWRGNEAVYEVMAIVKVCLSRLQHGCGICIMADSK